MESIEDFEGKRRSQEATIIGLMGKKFAPMAAPFSELFLKQYLEGYFLDRFCKKQDEDFLYGGSKAEDI